MEKTRIIFIEETDSTNRYLRDYAQDSGEDITVAVCSYQTAGRGQGTNSWESEPGQNLLFSILLHDVPLSPHRQFLLSMADALAQKDALSVYTDGITLKWPNDVYWKDRKLGGTLIETSLTGNRIRKCIIGTGINVNQRRFLSDAPNPVSLANILGKDIDIYGVLHSILTHFGRYYEMLRNEQYDEIIKPYHESLYRCTGMYAYEDCHGRFQAAIDHVEPDGPIILRRMDNSFSRYAFKEVKYVL